MCLDEEVQKQIKILIITPLLHPKVQKLMANGDLLLVADNVRGDL